MCIFVLDMNEYEELQKILYKNLSWKSDFLRELSIMDEILMNINSCEGEEQDFWFRVKKLYIKEYRNERDTNIRF